MRGNFSTNYQISGRELMTPDEVRLLDNKYCITFIRGERPVLDYKYDILKHPNIELSHDGKAKAYVHGFMPEETVELHDTPLDECIDITKDVETDMASEPDKECQVFAEDEFEQYLIKEKGKENEKEQQNKNA